MSESNESVDVGSIPRVLASTTTMFVMYFTYSVFVTGVPVRHQRYFERSIAHDLLERVPLIVIQTWSEASAGWSHTCF